jgi:hypothetical protein
MRTRRRLRYWKPMFIQKSCNLGFDTGVTGA